MLVIINGPCGVGKSTVSQCLSKKLDDCVYIRGDDVHNMIVDSQVILEHITITDQNISSLVKNFVSNGYKNIIIDNVYEEPSHLHAVVNELKKYIPDIYIFRLTCELKENIRRDGQRISVDVCGEKRVIELNEIYKNAQNGMGFVIDATHISAECIAVEIRKYINQKDMLYDPNNVN